MVKANKLALLSALVAGCGAASSPAPADPEPAPTVETNVFATIPYKTGTPSPKAKIFLVAGGNDIANFAAEVVEQKRIWSALGFSDEEIVCYYAKPGLAAYREDEQQFDALREDLRECYAATPGLLRRHLAQAARQDAGFVYLYITSHGIDSLWRLASESDEPKVRDFLKTIDDPEERALLDQYALGLNGIPSLQFGNVGAVIRAHRKGSNLADIVFTPQTLREILAGFPKSTAKYVILQACYSGGFLARASETKPDELITGIPNLTAITSTRYDRASFGCGPGEQMTYFGGAFTRVLERFARKDSTPPNIPWKKVYEEVDFVIRVMESVEGDEASFPTFFSNGTAESRSR